MSNSPYHIHKLAKRQGKTPEEVVKSALEQAGNANAAAVILGVSPDTVYSFMAVRGWTLRHSTQVVEPDREPT